MSGPLLAFSLLAGFVLLALVIIIIWAVRRRARDDGDEGGMGHLAEIREQIVWRALAQEGRITVAEAAAHGGQPESEVERALMWLVADGQATPEADDSGEIVYRIDISGASGAGDPEA